MKNSTSRHNPRNMANCLTTILLSLFLVFAYSCKKDTGDIASLLTTVPSSASGVIVVDLENILEDAGCKIKGSEIVASKEVLNVLDKASEKQKTQMMMLFEGEAGINPRGAVAFYDSSRFFLTFGLNDVAKFCEYVEKNNGNTFTDEGSGVKVCQNIAVKGAQAWVLLSEGRRIDADGIAGYASLNDSQSFLVTPYGEKLLVKENDIRGWSRLSTFLDEMERGQKSMATLAMGFLFEDAEATEFTIDFKKGEMDMESTILNNDGKAAKFQLPLEKVDGSTLKSAGQTCNAMVAFSITPKLVKKFEQVGGAFGGSLFNELSDKFKNIDGTVCVITNSPNVSNGIAGVVTTKGDVSQSLKDLISEKIAPVSMDGKLLKFSKGDVSGQLSVDECASALKGSYLGMIFDKSFLSQSGYAGQQYNWLSNVSFKINPDSGGLGFEIIVKTTEAKENSLLTILRNN